MNYNCRDSNYFIESCTDVVIWSGGVDSTLLLANLLEDASVNNPIGALSIDHSFLHAGKRQKEEEYRNKFIEEFIKPNKIPFVHETLSISTHHNFSGDHGMAQITAWVTMAVQMVNKDSTIHLGVLSGDDQVRRIHLVEELVETMNKMTGKNVKLSFPFLDNCKPKTYTLNHAALMDVLKYTWVCEMPIVKDKELVSCALGDNMCKSCITHLTNLIDSMFYARVKKDNKMISRLKVELARYGISNFSIKTLEELYTRFDSRYKL